VTHEVQPAEHAVSDKPKRRWYQFSLKTLLVVFTLASVSLGWLTYERNEVQKRETAIARIKELGGRVYFDEEKPFRRIWIVPLFGHRAFYEVRAVDLDETKVTDTDLAHLAGLTKLDLLSPLPHTGYRRWAGPSHWSFQPQDSVPQPYPSYRRWTGASRRS